MNNQHVITISNTTIAQEADVVLENISLNVYKGEFVYLVGRTGSGKSSLLKTLYADLTTFEGNVMVADYDIEKIKQNEIPFLRRKLGIIFQDFELFSDRSVYDNLEFVLKATGWKTSSKIRERISEVLMRVGLEASSKKMPHQLSGGEQQRIVIARALLNEPLILLADEPTGNLDPEVSEEILKIFEDINNSGTAILMATHDIELIKKHTKRTIKCVNKGIEEFAV